MSRQQLQVDSLLALPPLLLQLRPSRLRPPMQLLPQLQLLHPCLPLRPASFPLTFLLM